MKYFGNRCGDSAGGGADSPEDHRLQRVLLASELACFLSRKGDYCKNLVCVRLPRQWYDEIIPPEARSIIAGTLAMCVTGEGVGIIR